MNEVTKQDLQEVKDELKQNLQEVKVELKNDVRTLREDVGEMFTQQTKTLIEHFDGFKKELKRDIVDLRTDLYAEVKTKISEHVKQYH